MSRAGRIWRVVGIAAAVFVALVLVVPLVWPVPALEGTAEPPALARAGDKFVEVDGVRFAYRERGSANASRTILLLHGFGASTFSWRDQFELLSSDARVIAFDRPAFGLTERPLPGSFSAKVNPYALSASTVQTVELMDALGVERATLVGHSAGGLVAAAVTEQHPDRVEALVLEDPAIFATRGVSSALSPLLRTPQMRRIGPLIARRLAGPQGDAFVRRAFFDPSKVTTDVLAGYRYPLKARDWDKALWEFTAAPRDLDVAGRLGSIGVPTLVIAGAEDRIVAVDSIERVAAEIPGAQLVVFPRTGHIPHEERPAEFAARVREFLDAQR